MPEVPVMVNHNSDFEFEKQFTQRLCEVVDSPRALSVWLCLKYGDHESLLSLTAEPEHYNFAGDFADDYLVTQILRKSLNLELSADPASTAYATWRSCHVKNRETNHRFEMTDYVDHPSWWPKYIDYLRRILGPLDTATLNEIADMGKHGPGAVAGVKGGVEVDSDKFDKETSLSPKLLPFAQALMGPSWFNYRQGFKDPFQVYDAEVYFGVRKDAGTDRSCAKGTVLQIFAQLGLGLYLRSRLRLFGVNLQDQSLNQFLASKAQEWRLATIDLKTASELMAFKPIEQSLPDRWFHLFNLLRADKVVIPKSVCGAAEDVVVKQQKFCAMGNGFTFPLQTAVFLSVVRSIVPASEHGLTTAYGDDIICPQKYASEVLSALEYLGFDVNHRKTFLAGRFFESCGTDWFDSQNVRPFFLRRDPESAVPYPVSTANSLRLWAERRAFGRPGCDARFERLWTWCVDQVPSIWKHPVPREFGDSGIIVEFDEAMQAGPRAPRALADLKAIPGAFDVLGKPLSCKGWQGYALRTVRVKSKTTQKVSKGVLLSHLNRLRFKKHDGISLIDDPDLLPMLKEYAARLGPSEPFSCGREPVRRFLGLPKLGWTTCLGWSEGLEWIR